MGTSGGERENIAKMAEKISDDIFKFFRWKKVGVPNTNFECTDPSDHSKDKDSKSHTHPVDTVFCYYDPYIKKQVYLNTDLKSYKSNSITQKMIREALTSLAQTIDCCRNSDQWVTRYVSTERNWEVRGFLFVYNNDGQFDRNFYNYINGSFNPITKKTKNTAIDLTKVPIKKDQKIHIADPKSINYFNTICNDIKHLAYNDILEKDSYDFFYPDKTRIKAETTNGKSAATIEKLMSPFMILRHPLILDSDKSRLNGEGYIIYYNRTGKNNLEFVYLLDLLSSYQILRPGNKVRVRVANQDSHSEATANFNTAVETCALNWGFCEERKEQLKSIEFEVLTTKIEVYSETAVGWGVQ